MLIHNHNGFKLLLRLAYKRFGDRVLGYPPLANRPHEQDTDLPILLGEKKHTGKDKNCACECKLCAFNSKENLKDPKYRIMVRA